MVYDMRRALILLLGGFWLLDGVLQLQPAMFTSAFLNQVLMSNLQGQPRILSTIIAFGIHVFNGNIFWFNVGSAVIQLLIAVLLLLPLNTKTQNFGLWLSVVWGVAIWIFGEGLGSVFTGSATFYTGAPGSALLYVILALSLLYSFEKKLPMIGGCMFLFGVVLNLMPIFWQPTMLSMLATVPKISGWLGMFGAEGTIIGNLIAISILAFFAIFLIVNSHRVVAWTAVIFLVLVWWIGQNFGGLATFPGGTATDPNSSPILMLFLLPMFLRIAADTSPLGTQSQVR